MTGKTLWLLLLLVYYMLSNSINCSFIHDNVNSTPDWSGLFQYWHFNPWSGKIGRIKWHEWLHIFTARYVERYFYFFASSFVFKKRNANCILFKNGDSKNAAESNKECYFVCRQMAAASSFFAPLPLVLVCYVYSWSKEKFSTRCLWILDCWKNWWVSLEVVERRKETE